MPEAQAKKAQDILRARDAPPGTRPTAQDLAQPTLVKKVRRECLAHPATIYTAAGSLLAIAWMAIVAVSPAAIAVMVGAAVVSACSFIYNFVMRGKERIKERQQELLELQRQHDLYEVYRLGQLCLEKDFEEGAKEAAELIIGYEKLMKYLTEKGQADSLFAFQAEDAYKQGCKTLKQAVQLYNGLGEIDTKTLKRELKAWQGKLDGMEDKDSREAGTLKRQIESHTRRLEQHEQETVQLGELFAQLNEIEAALESAHLDMIGLDNQDVLRYISADGGAVGRLRGAVEAKKRITSRLSGEDARAEKEAQDNVRNKYIRIAREAADREAGGSEREGVEE